MCLPHLESGNLCISKLERTQKSSVQIPTNIRILSLTSLTIQPSSEHTVTEHCTLMFCLPTTFPPDRSILLPSASCFSQLWFYQEPMFHIPRCSAEKALEPNWAYPTVALFGLFKVEQLVTNSFPKIFLAKCDSENFSTMVWDVKLRHFFTWCTRESVPTEKRGQHSGKQLLFSVRKPVCLTVL